MTAIRDDESYMRQFDDAVRITTAALDRIDEGNWLAVFHRNTRLFCIGDMVIAAAWNGGGERWPIYGRSSRGCEISYKYEQYARYRERGAWQPAVKNGPYVFGPFRCICGDQYNNKSTIRLVDVPREVMSECSSSGAAPLRRWLSEALRAGYAARGVGSGSAALLPPLPYCESGRPSRARRKQRGHGDANGVMW